MSKSLGNFYTIKDALKLHEAEVIRYIVLSHHYSSKIDFSMEAFRVAEKRMFYFYKTLKVILEFLEMKGTSGEKGYKGTLNASFVEAMDDNFNTAKAIGAISIAFTEANNLFADKRIGDDLKIQQLTAFVDDVKRIAPVLGLFDTSPALALKALKAKYLQRIQLSEAELDVSIAARLEAKKNRDFATADAIRNQLAAKGIKLLDSATQSEWEIGEL